VRECEETENILEEVKGIGLFGKKEQVYLIGINSGRTAILEFCINYSIFLTIFNLIFYLTILSFSKIGYNFSLTTPSSEK